MGDINRDSFWACANTRTLERAASVRPDPEVEPGGVWANQRAAFAPRDALGRSAVSVRARPSFGGGLAWFWALASL